MSDTIPPSEKQIEKSAQLDDNRVSDDEAADFSHVDAKKVLRKMDLHLIPMLSVLYLLSFLDRGNIGNAKIEGLAEDLHLTGAQYNWCCRRNSPCSS